MLSAVAVAPALGVVIVSVVATVPTLIHRGSMSTLPARSVCFTNTPTLPWGAFVKLVVVDQLPLVHVVVALKMPLSTTGRPFSVQVPVNVTLAALLRLIQAPGLGEVNATVGGVESRVSVRVTEGA